MNGWGMLLAGWTLWWVLSLIAAGMLPSLLSLAVTWPHAERERLCWALLVSPLLLSIVLIGLLVAPTLASPLLAHCHALGCETHIPELIQPQGGLWSAWLIVSLVLLYGFRDLAGWRKLSAWRGLSVDHGRYRELKSESALAVTAGLVRPQIYISSGLCRQLSARALEVVLQHEERHCQRADNLRLRVARCLCSLWPRASAGKLLDELELTHEQACDAHAANQLRDPLIVAQTLIDMGRLSGVSGAASFTGSALEARVHALLEPATERRTQLSWWCHWFILWSGSIPLLLLPLHRLLEL